MSEYFFNLLIRGEYGSQTYYVITIVPFYKNSVRRLTKLVVVEQNVAQFSA